MRHFPPCCWCKKLVNAHFYLNLHYSVTGLVRYLSNIWPVNSEYWGITRKNVVWKKLLLLFLFTLKLLQFFSCIWKPLNCPGFEKVGNGYKFAARKKDWLCCLHALYAVLIFAGFNHDCGFDENGKDSYQKERLSFSMIWLLKFNIGLILNISCVFPGDIILEVDGTNVEEEDHKTIVTHIHRPSESVRFVTKLKCCIQYLLAVKSPWSR